MNFDGFHPTGWRAPLWLSLLLMNEEDILELLHKFIVLFIEWKI